MKKPIFTPKMPTIAKTGSRYDLKPRCICFARLAFAFAEKTRVLVRLKQTWGILGRFSGIPFQVAGGVA